MSMMGQPAAAKQWPDYRAVWRWHFYAGLFCIPFVILLATSGSIYLFKPQIEAWMERAYDRLPVQEHPAAAAEQIKAALAAVPGSTLNSYEIPDRPDSAARVVVAANGGATRVYVHPESLKVLGTTDENTRLMRKVFRFHGELWMGNRGSAVVELAASWTIVMILTGLYLWWPRTVKGLGGILYPRLAGSRNIFWRDLHGVTGFWVSGLALVLLLTGLPWAKFWGDYLRRVRALTGTAVVRQDWTNGAAPPVGAGHGGGHQSSRAFGGDSGSSQGGRSRPGTDWGSGRRPGRRRRTANPSLDLAAVDRIAASVRPLALDSPVVVEPPAVGSNDWSVASMTPNRPRRVNLVADGNTGAIKQRKDFRDRHWIDRLIGTGIAAHEGQLFGWPNQLLGVLTALGLVVLSISSITMWQRRRAPGTLGAPGAAANPHWAWGLIAVVVLLGAYLPLFGTSLIAMLAVEWTLLRRIPAVRDWLGLARPRFTPDRVPLAT
jgi:uncharacterized iron-regulated membrane protein